MNRFTSIGAIFSVLLLSGCGGESYAPNLNWDDGTTITTFDGTWSNGCEYDQFFGTGDILTLEINGPSATISLATYGTDDCSGDPTGSASAPFNISYPGEIVLSDCYNGEKINASLDFPITLDGVPLTEEQYAALPVDEQVIEIGMAYDLFCTNQEGTILYTGDETTGDGTSDATRPTSADLTSGINKVL